MLSLFWGLTISSAEAFCGTYVGGSGSEFFNEYSQVAFVRDGNTTTLTIVNDIQGDFNSFALVIPVPEVMPEENIHTLDAELFDRLDAYSEPRLVSYVCEDFEIEEPEMNFGSTSDTGSVEDGGVEVEAHYVIGEFDIVILSAEQSGGLFDWLTANGYSVPGQSRDLLEEYIAEGLFFLAAKVHSEAGIQDGDTLSPLQLRYESPAMQLPIRIGTLNSKEEQDLVIYGVNPYSNGRLGISNYLEFSIEDECMWLSEGESFGEYYSDQFTKGYQGTTEAAWTMEYAWGGGGCDPCSGTPPDGDDLVSLGLNEEYIHYGEYFFTRLHMRYTPQQVDEEIMLYLSGITDPDQYRFIEYNPQLEDRFEVCGVGMVDNPRSCDDQGSDGVDQQGNTTVGSSCGGCSGRAAASPIALFLGLISLYRRRE